MAKTYEEFYEDLGKRESNGYKTDTGNGMLGKYQLSKPALIDLGYIDKNTGKWTGKNGIHNKYDFLNSSKLQDEAAKEYNKIQLNYMKFYANKHHGRIINGIKMTYSSMMAGAHLIGHSRMIQYLEHNGKAIDNGIVVDKSGFKDGYNTHVEEYLKSFQGYDVSKATGISYDPVKDSVQGSEEEKEGKIKPSSKKQEKLKEQKELSEYEKEYKKVRKDPYSIPFNYQPEEIQKMSNKEFLENMDKIEEISDEARWKVQELLKRGVIKKNQTPYKNTNPIKQNTKQMSHETNNDYNHKSNNDWSDKDIAAMLEGFDSGELGEGNKSYRNKDDWKKQFNVGDPNTDKGHWITMNGTHIFIKDKV